MFPGDPTGSPGNVCNCKCFTYAVLDKEGQALENRNSRAEVLAHGSLWRATLPQDETGVSGHRPTPIVEVMGRQGKA